MIILTQESFSFCVNDFFNLRLVINQQAELSKRTLNPSIHRTTYSPTTIESSSHNVSTHKETMKGRRHNRTTHHIHKPCSDTPLHAQQSDRNENSADATHLPPRCIPFQDEWAPGTNCKSQGSTWDKSIQPRRQTHEHVLR